MKKTTFVGALAAPLLMFAMTLPSHADSTDATLCKDGTPSAKSGRGACSGHGGVQKMGAKAAAAPAAASAMPAAAPAAAAKAAAGEKEAGMDPTGATAKCKDGTFSKAKTHTGACSRHGGVADWMGASK